MKNVFRIPEVMQLYGITSRMTFMRMRKRNIVPEPDVGKLYSRACLEQKTPGITQGA